MTRTIVVLHDSIDLISFEMTDIKHIFNVFLIRLNTKIIILKVPKLMS